MAKVDAVPKGYHTLTPEMTLEDCAGAIAFYKKVFGAEEITRALDPSGRLIMHAALRIGDSTLFLSDVIPNMTGPARPGSLFLYRENIDELFQKAVAAGCRVVMPLADQFWGDRMGKLADKWGVDWSFAQQVKILTPAEIDEAQRAFLAPDEARVARKAPRQLGR